MKRALGSLLLLLACEPEGSLLMNSPDAGRSPSRPTLPSTADSPDSGTVPPSPSDGGMVDVDTAAGPKVLAMRWVNARTGEVLGTQLTRGRITEGVALDVSVEASTSGVTYGYRDSTLTEGVAPFRWCGTIGASAAPCLPSLFVSGQGQVLARAFDRSGLMGPQNTLSFTVVEGSDAGVIVAPPLDAGTVGALQLVFVNRTTQAKTPVRSGDTWPTPASDFSILLDQPASSARFEIVSRGFTQNEGVQPYFMCGDDLNTGALACPMTVLAAGTIELRVTAYAGAMQTGTAISSTVVLRFP